MTKTTYILGTHHHSDDLWGTRGKETCQKSQDRSVQCRQWGYRDGATNSLNHHPYPIPHGTLCRGHGNGRGKVCRKYRTFKPKQGNPWGVNRNRLLQLHTEDERTGNPTAFRIVCHSHFLQSYQLQIVTTRVEGYTKAFSALMSRTPITSQIRIIRICGNY